MNDNQNPKREIGKWLVTLVQSKCVWHGGVFLYQNGTAEFFDIFSHRLMFNIFASDSHCVDQFWLREIFDEYSHGGDADQVCLCSRKIVVEEQVKKWILRANRKHVYSVDEAGEHCALAAMINDHLEVQYWLEIAQFCTYSPVRRDNLREPQLPFPTHSSELQEMVNLPTELPKPWWE